MYNTRTKDGRNNIAGVNIKRLRKKLAKKTTHQDLAEMLQHRGLDIDRNAIQRIESGARFITDIELKMIARVLQVTCDDLLGRQTKDL